MGMAADNDRRPHLLQETSQGLFPRAGSMGKLLSPVQENQEGLILWQMSQAGQILPGEPDLFSPHPGS